MALESGTISLTQSINNTNLAVLVRGIHAARKTHTLNSVHIGFMATQ